MLNMDYKNKIHDGNLNLDDKSFNEGKMYLFATFLEKNLLLILKICTAPPLCVCDGNV